MSHHQDHAGAVVLHASDKEADVQRAMASADNLQQSFPGIRVHIVVNGPALDGLVDLEVNLDDQVSLSACSVGLGKRNIDTGALSNRVNVVPTAPEVIIREQFAGAAYMRL